MDTTLHIYMIGARVVGQGTLYIGYKRRWNRRDRVPPYALGMCCCARPEYNFNSLLAFPLYSIFISYSVLLLTPRRASPSYCVIDSFSPAFRRHNVLFLLI